MDGVCDIGSKIFADAFYGLLGGIDGSEVLSTASRHDNFYLGPELPGNKYLQHCHRQLPEGRVDVSERSPSSTSAS